MFLRGSSAVATPSPTHRGIEFTKPSPPKGKNDATAPTTTQPMPSYADPNPRPYGLPPAWSVVTRLTLPIECVEYPYYAVEHPYYPEEYPYYPVEYPYYPVEHPYYPVEHPYYAGE